MLNRRKALIGWLVYSAAKPVAKRAVKVQAKKTAQKSASSSQTKGGKGRTAARIGAVAAIVGGVLFWRNRRSNDDELPPT